MSRKGYWTRISKTQIGAKKPGHPTIKWDSNSVVLRICNENCPIEGHAGNLDDAKREFIASYAYYSRNDPEVIPTLQDFDNDKPKLPERDLIFIDAENLEAA